MFLTQQVPISLYVEPGPDLTFSARDDQLLTLVAPTAQEVSRIKHTTKIAHKRNRLLVRGDSPYVYLADADVSFEKHPFLPGMIRGMTDHPQLGMVGLCYQDTPHVACGSMLVRRQDIEAIGAIRDTASWCACMFLGRQIKEMGLRVVPLERSRATELDLAELGGQPVPDVHLAVASDGAVPRRSLEALLQQHGTRFRLFVSVRAGAR
jgi:hypothetical protein